MRTVRIKVYKFAELSEKSKEKVIEKFSNINVDHEWWESTYDDAENIGLKLTGFDLDRGSYCKGEFIDSANETANKILKEHGENCGTYKTAAGFLDNWKELVKKYSDGVNTDRVSEGKEYEFDQEADELESQFLKALLNDYLTMLRDGYEYLTGRDAVIEMIDVNEYEFTADGNFFSQK